MALHIEGTSNTIPDRLSRGKIAEALAIARPMVANAEVIDLPEDVGSILHALEEAARMAMKTKRKRGQDEANKDKHAEKERISQANE